MASSDADRAFEQFDEPQTHFVRTLIAEFTKYDQEFLWGSDNQALTSLGMHSVVKAFTPLHDLPNNEQILLASRFAQFEQLRTTFKQASLSRNTFTLKLAPLYKFYLSSRTSEYDAQTSLKMYARVLAQIVGAVKTLIIDTKHIKSTDDGIVPNVLSWVVCYLVAAKRSTLDSLVFSKDDHETLPLRTSVLQFVQINEIPIVALTNAWCSSKNPLEQQRFIEVQSSMSTVKHVSCILQHPSFLLSFFNSLYSMPIESLVLKIADGIPPTPVLINRRFINSFFYLSSSLKHFELHARKIEDFHLHIIVEACKYTEVVYFIEAQYWSKPSVVNVVKELTVAFKTSPDETPLEVKNFTISTPFSKKYIHDEHFEGDRAALRQVCTSVQFL